MPIPPPQSPPSSAEPSGQTGRTGQNGSPLPGNQGPGGLSGGAKTGVNVPGRTGKAGRQDV